MLALLERGRDLLAKLEFSRCSTGDNGQVPLIETLLEIVRAKCAEKSPDTDA